MEKHIYLTPEKIQNFKLEFEELAAQRKQVTERVKLARDLGDLTENTEYIGAKQELERIDRRMAEVEHIVSHTKTITKPESQNKIVLGSVVTILRNDKTERRIQVVGTIEADPLNGKVSDESPFGQSLLGKAKGESVTINTLAGITVYTIIDIQ